MKNDGQDYSIYLNQVCILILSNHCKMTLLSPLAPQTFHFWALLPSSSTQPECKIFNYNLVKAGPLQVQAMWVPILIARSLRPIWLLCFKTKPHLKASQLAYWWPLFPPKAPFVKLGGNRVTLAVVFYCKAHASELPSRHWYLWGLSSRPPVC